PSRTRACKTNPTRPGLSLNPICDNKLGQEPETTNCAQKEAAMIRGVHTMFYSSKADELRAFIRDKLRFTFTDVHDGWLIFDLPDAEMGVHPTDHPPSQHHQSPASGTHQISFYCDDVHAT